MNQYPARIPGVSGLLTLTGSTSGQAAFEDPQLRHGVFTYYVAQALQGQADRDGDGVVTAAELVDYVRNHVVEHTVGQQRQTPRENQDFPEDLILAFNPKRGHAESTLAEGSLVIQSNMDNVELLLDGVPKGIVNRNTPLPLPGIKAGTHTVKAVKMGYDPDGPREVTVYPGVNTPVTIRIQFARTRKQSAERLFTHGHDKYEKAKTESQCREAIEFFKKALREDPKYSEAAMYLAHTYRMLLDTESAERYYKTAIEIDPDYLEARLSYGAMLTDVGNTDGAIRQLMLARERNENDDQIYSHLAHAYRVAGNFDLAAQNARKALELNLANAQAHLWLADCLRYYKKFSEAAAEYNQFIRLTDFDADLTSKLMVNWIFKIPFYNPLTTKAGSRTIVYRDLRNQGFFGLCVCEQNLNNFNVATQYCRKALRYDPNDPYSYFHLGWIDLDRYNLTPRREYLTEARTNFLRVIDINPDLQEANKSRQYLEQIGDNLKQVAAR